ncbi:hypothetical protein TorRG33x02_172050 [Trema orientale]|uniref:Uncharacterized protein n=1 Tax=Trema orientale TaxID=63057 RepID=A0A2P5EN14_TREOI|nr:hypothetical protein TorRG33x02_172050 [Trema orientale]
MKSRVFWSFSLLHAPKLGTHHGRGGGGHGSGASRPIFEICGKQGHVALACWHRMEESFQPATIQNQLHNNPTATAAVAFLATPETIADPHRYTDTGATDYVSANLDNLVISIEYNG